MADTAPRDVVVDLALSLREQLVGELGAHAGRVHADAGRDGDITFAIDERAEAFTERFLAERAPRLAMFSEDRGMVSPSDGAAEWVLVVDPIDGTRPALAGLESACVAIAAAPLDDAEPTMADVALGVVVEIKSGAVFRAERGRGVEPVAHLSPNTEIARMFWTYGFRGRPARELTEVLAELIDASSVQGGTFDLGSASFDMTRILTGQLDAYVEPGPRLVEEVAGMRERFLEVGGGSILNNTPYDIAAATLCLWEAGAVVTDARGEPLDRRPLLGSGPGHQMSCVAAANAELHSAICSSLDSGVERLARLGAATALD